MTKTLVKMQFGSHVYGTNVPESDQDFKGVFIPSARDILLQRVTPTIVCGTKADKTARNSAEDTDLEMFSLQQYLKLLMEGQTVALDMMFTPESFYTECEPPWRWLQKNRLEFFSKKSAAFVGYCRTQANKYGIKGSRVGTVRTMLEIFSAFESGERLENIIADVQDSIENLEHAAFVVVPHVKNNLETTYLEVCNRKFQLGQSVKQVRQTLERINSEYGHRAQQAANNEGVDWKALMHATRVIYEAKEFLSTGFITQPRPERELLLKIRKEEMPYKEVAEIIEQGVADVAEAEKTSILPNEPNYEFADDFVAEVYQNVIV